MNITAKYNFEGNKGDALVWEVLLISIYGDIATSSTIYTETLASSTSKTYSLDLSAYSVLAGPCPEIFECDTILYPLPVQITKVISNQLEGVECNELPTGLPYKGDMNNPMIMATQQGAYGSFGVVVQLPQNLSQNMVSNFLVGVRKAGSTDVLGYAPVTSTSGTTYVYFNANSGVNAINYNTYYEVVVGYDTNGNGVLDPSEVVYVYGMQDNAAESSPQDKAVVVESDDYQSALTYLTNLTSVSWIALPAASDLLNAFINPSSPPPGSNATTFTLYSNDPDLKCPIGAYWTQCGDDTGSATANFYTFPNGSSVSNEVAGSSTFEYFLWTQISDPNVKTVVDAYFASNPNASQHTFNLEPFDTTIHFSDKELLGAYSDLNLAFGTIELTGSLSIIVNKDPIFGTIYLNSISYNAGFNDIYDFYFFQKDKLQLNTSAAILQAGYGTLGNAGRVFESSVNFSGTVTSEYEFGSSYVY